MLEVTSSNWKADLKTKIAAYAEAQVPVYVIVDRKHERLHVLTDPAGGDVSVPPSSHPRRDRRSARQYRRESQP